jgi:hypothetical protein
MSGQMPDVSGRAGDEIVEGHDFVTGGQQVVAEMRADKTGCSRNKMAQGNSLKTF